MALEVKIEKKYVFIFLGLILLIGGIFIATAYGTNNPPNFGHTPGELSAGVFGGTANDAWRFPGPVHFGGAGDASRGFYVTNSETGSRAFYLANGSWAQGTVNVAILPESRFLGIWTPDPRVETHIRQERFNALRLSSGAGYNAALQLYKNDGTTNGNYWGWTILKQDNGDFLINYDRGENGAGAGGGFMNAMALKPDGTVRFPTLSGSGDAHLCIHANGDFYRGTASGC